MKLFPPLIFLLVFTYSYLFSQDDPKRTDGIEVIVPDRQKTGNAYFFFAGGYQFPSWTRVPMTPENSAELKMRGNMEVYIPGWTAGIGVMKKTKSRFEAGLLADYYRNSVRVAISGQSSTSEWVYEQSGNTSYFTRVIENDINRINEAISFRGTVRYKVPVGMFRVWGGLTGGTFSNYISFVENSSSGFKDMYSETSLGLSFQAGIDIALKDKDGLEIVSISLISDFSAPEIEEKIFMSFNPGWRYVNSEGNFAVNPVRIAFAVGFHIR